MSIISSSCCSKQDLRNIGFHSNSSNQPTTLYVASHPRSVQRLRTYHASEAERLRKLGWNVVKRKLG